MSDDVHIPADLAAFLAETRDARAYRRGLAATMALQGYLCACIASLLGVTPGFVSQAKKPYVQQGVAG
jgi:hypothetical protein